MCGVWSLGFTKLSGPSCKAVRLQTLKKRLLPAPCSQREYWLGCSAGHGLFLVLWVFLENMPDPVLLDLLLFGFPFICVGLVLPTLYIMVFLSQPVPR